MHPLTSSLRIMAFATPEATSRAIEIAAVGMLMVFAALVLLTVFLTLLPRMLGSLAAIWPETAEHHLLADAAAQVDDEEDVLAAIGYVLHAEAQKQP